MSELVWSFLGMEPSADQLIERTDELLEGVRRLENRVQEVDRIRRHIECLQAIPSKTAPPGL